MALIGARGEDPPPAPAAQVQPVADAGAEPAESETDQPAPSQPQADPDPPPTQSNDPARPGDDAAEPAAPAQPAAAPPQQEQQEEPAAEPELTGFIVPIAGFWRARGDCSQPGALITSFPGHLPGADREYRFGVHEGIDFYAWASCIPINDSTEIRAAKDGRVIRADHQYVEVTPAEWAAFERAGWRGEPILDRLRGRQVWLDHGAGVVTRYAHLGAIHPDVAEGGRVAAGQIIGRVGESGQSAVWEAPGSDLHLHFEIRIGDQYLGQGLPPAQARLLYLNAFAIDP